MWILKLKTVEEIKKKRFYSLHSPIRKLIFHIFAVRPYKFPYFSSLHILTPSSHSSTIIFILYLFLLQPCHTIFQCAISFHCSAFWFDQINNKQMCWYFTPRVVVVVVFLLPHHFSLSGTRVHLEALSPWTLYCESTKRRWEIQLEKSTGEGTVLWFSFSESFRMPLKWFCSGPCICAWKR